MSKHVKRWCLISVAVGLLTTARLNLQAASLIGTEVVLDNTLEIDPVSLNYTILGPTFGTPGPLSRKTMSGLAYDDNTDTLYGTSPSTDQLFAIDRLSGLGTEIGPIGGLGFPNVNGLAFNPALNVLYASDTDTNTLLVVDPVSGLGSAIGVISGAENVEGLAFDAASQTLYGIASLPGASLLSLTVRLDVNTALATPLPIPLPSAGNWRGLGFDSTTNKLFASLVLGTEIYEIDPSDGSSTYLGTTGGTNSSLQGLAVAMPEPGVAGWLPWLVDHQTQGEPAEGHRPSLIPQPHSLRSK